VRQAYPGAEHDDEKRHNRGRDRQTMDTGVHVCSPSFDHVSSFSRSLRSLFMLSPAS
jgi:hypothetical protein